MSKVCKKVCDADKICNPKTGRCVLRSGAIGKEILGLAKPKSKSKVSKAKPQQAPMSVCDHFIANPSINPWTGKKIKEGGKIYLELSKNCYGVDDPSVSVLFDYMTSMYTPEKKEKFKREWMEETGLPIALYGLVDNPYKKK